jgi:hypothetical protein
VDYVYLDTEERLKFARANHEYLIEQIQMKEELNVRSPNIKIILGFNHPMKELLWVTQLDMLVGKNTVNDRFNFTNSHMYTNNTLDGVNLTKTAVLQLNGTERWGNRQDYYFNLQQPLISHYKGPVTGINVYNMGLNPEKHQPSGTCNMSKIDYLNLELHLDNVISSQNTAKVRVYCLNYNILRVFYGLGGLAFTTY